MEGDVNLVVVLVDFIEERLHARKHSSVDAVASRLPDLLSETAVRMFVECLMTVDKSCAQLGEVLNTIFQSVKKVDPQAQHVRGIVSRTVGEFCQVFELGTFALEVASTFAETCFDLGRDITGLIRCTGDVCGETPELR